MNHPLTPHCGSMMHGSGEDVKMCAPLAQLTEEHVLLTEKMDRFHNMAEQIGEDPGVSDWTPSLRELKEKVADFIAELEPHSIREEDILFLLMAKYIGREAGPIAVMEYEHELAKQNLSSFMEAMKNIGNIVNQDDAKVIAAYLIEAYNILSGHFYKEENVLFPMAERLLSTEEKEQLGRDFLKM